MTMGLSTEEDDELAVLYNRQSAIVRELNDVSIKINALTNKANKNVTEGLERLEKAIKK